jgi:hypothetical protein
MTTNPMETVDTSWKGLYRWGGVLAMLAAVLLFIAIACAIAVGTPSSYTGEGVLKGVSGQATFAYTFYGLAIVADILLVPFVLALYLALKGVNKSAMLTAAVFGGLALALDLGVHSTSAIAFVNLSQNYAAATSDVQRATFVAIADYAYFGMTSVSDIVSFTVFSTWGLIVGLVMLRGVFSKATAYVGIAASIVGLAYSATVFVPYSPSLEILVAIALVLFGVWLLLAGSRLYGLGKR